MTEKHEGSAFVRLGEKILSGYLPQSERVVLYLVATVMAVLAILLLAYAVYSLFLAVATNQIREKAIEILSSILLVMMISEIIRTAIISLEKRKLDAVPFLTVGAIATIRRMLVITAEGTKFAVDNPEAFRNTLIELGLLAVTIILIATSIYILLRSRRFIDSSESGGRG